MEIIANKYKIMIFDDNNTCWYIDFVKLGRVCGVKIDGGYNVRKRTMR